MECHKGPCKREAGLSRIVVQDYVMSEQRNREREDAVMTVKMEEAMSQGVQVAWRS